MKTGKTIKFILCALFAAVMTLFAGCEAHIDVYEQQDEDAWYFAVQISVPDGVVKTLNAGAAYSEKYGEKWTLERWLADYFEVISDIGGFTYGAEEVWHDDGMTQYRFPDIIVPKADCGEYMEEGLAFKGDTDVSTNLFMRVVSVVRDDRFNFWINEFEDALSRYNAGEKHPGDNQTLMGIILFGTEVNGETELPGFSDAFASAEMNDYTKALLTDFWYASKKMNVACDGKVEVVYEDGTRDRRGRYYVFQKTAGDGETSVRYEYFRADPTGWYIIALLCGGAAVGIAVWTANAMKRKRDRAPRLTPKDYYPYDPFEDNDHIDPFA